MKKDLCEIIVLMDQSSSMMPIKRESITAFNKFLEDQKKLPGTAQLTLTLFAWTSWIKQNGVDLKNVEPLNEYTYEPCGSTALYDALGKTIDEVGVRLNNTPEDQRPERVLVAVLTDGEENSSKTFTREQVFEKIKHQREKYSWEFVFLAQGPEAFAEAQGLGFQQSHTVNYAKQDHAATVQSLSASVASYRSGGKANLHS